MAKVELLGNQTSGYQLIVDGAPFFIKGAGLEFGRLESLVLAGGNAFRTWRVTNGERDATDILDEAQALGLKVCMGLDIARERHGFDYSDQTAVDAQTEQMMRDVLRLKDHPALLMWGLGNELNLRAKNDGVWDAVEALALRIKSQDPDHPVTTMLAGIDAHTVDAIAKRAPSLDFLSFQIYGEIDHLPKILDEAGYDGPYQITEWGPTGHWESPETVWGRPFEPSSTQKANDILRRYEDIILSDAKRCLGAYIFLWGQKQERTPTWYGMFLETGERTEAVEVMQKVWTGHLPKHNAPKIQSLLLNQKEAPASIEAGVDQVLSAEVMLTGNDNDLISWRVREEVPAALQSDGGDFEPTPPTLHSLAGTHARNFSFKLSKPGEYRLFCQVDAPEKTSAVSNIPFLIKPKPLKLKRFLNLFGRKAA
jgi:hypothetical protein